MNLFNDAPATMASTALSLAAIFAALIIVGVAVAAIRKRLRR